MYNFNIQFSNPWLLLLLIPAVALAIIPYFRLSKKYRKTRNRIVSIVLYITIMALSVSLFAGVKLNYQVSNPENEIILLVDFSDTQEQSESKRDEFVKRVIETVKFDDFKVGIVTFGFDQRYAVPLTDDIDSIYESYMRAETPDPSATNIAAALSYTKQLFTYKESAKIVLISDGKETDEEASTIIRSIVAQGTTVDTALIPSGYSDDEVQIINAELPDHHMVINEEYTINVTLQNKGTSTVIVEMYVDGKVDSENGKQVVLLEETGTFTLGFKHTFITQGLHKINFKTTSDNDLLEENNQYNIYLYLDVFDKVLILESRTDESKSLLSLLNAEDAFNVTVKNLYDSDDIPESINQLREYDQIILNNVSNADLTNENLPELFDVMLHDYVKEYGGAVLTVGGNKEGEKEANAYNRQDLYNTKYQDMLPVQAINYTPPIAVVAIVDRSGSMGDIDYDQNTNLDWARAGTSHCLEALTERDYFGLITLDSEYEVILPITPLPEKSKIKAAIDTLRKTTGGTVFPQAIDVAGRMLRAARVDRRHIILVTDGGVPENQREEYEKLVEGFYEADGTTLSVVAISVKKDSEFDENTPIDLVGTEKLTPYTRMLRAVILGHGRILATQDPSAVVDWMKRDLEVPERKEMNYESFQPSIYNARSPLLNGIIYGDEDDTKKFPVQINGFYGTKAKTDADVVLSGEYDVPIYAQWQLGKGMVGSFLLDLKGIWSSELLNDPNGKIFIQNAVRYLMPMESIRPNDISINLNEYNYINELSVYSDLEEGEYIEGKIIDLSSPDEEFISLNSVTEVNSIELADYYVTSNLSEGNDYSRVNFVIKKSGIYKIVLTKYDADGLPIGDGFYAYKTFSFSKEYNAFLGPEDESFYINTMINLARRGNGEKIADLEDPHEVTKGFIVDIDKSYHPRNLFIIIIILLFLLDIMVRKFKFKWPHEIYREYKLKKSSM